MIAKNQSPLARVIEAAGALADEVVRSDVEDSPVCCSVIARVSPVYDARTDLSQPNASDALLYEMRAAMRDAELPATHGGVSRTDKMRRIVAAWAAIDFAATVGQLPRAWLPIEQESALPSPETVDESPATPVTHGARESTESLIARYQVVLAEAEERGRKAERADVVAWLRARGYPGPEYTLGSLADWIEEEGSHVGAAERAKGGRS